MKGNINGVYKCIVKISFTSYIKTITHRSMLITHLVFNVIWIYIFPFITYESILWSGFYSILFRVQCIGPFSCICVVWQSTSLTNLSWYVPVLGAGKLHYSMEVSVQLMLLGQWDGHDSNLRTIKMRVRMYIFGSEVTLCCFKMYVLMLLSSSHHLKTCIYRGMSESKLPLVNEWLCYM